MAWRHVTATAAVEKAQMVSEPQTWLPVLCTAVSSRRQNRRCLLCSRCFQPFLEHVNH